MQLLVIAFLLEVGDFNLGFAVCSLKVLLQEIYCCIYVINYGIAGGFGSYLLGLNRRTYEQAGVDTDGNTPNTKEPGIGWMTGFLFVSCFVGLLALVPLRKVCFVFFILFSLEIDLGILGV